MVKDFWSMTSDGLVESGRVGVSVVINGYVVEPDSRSVVSIPFGQHELRHGVPYGLRFDNHRTNMAGLQYAPPRRTYVAVTIDGVFQGEWILLAGRMGAFTDRGAHDSGIWTFFASQSAAYVVLAGGIIDPADVDDSELREAIEMLPAMTGDSYIIDPMGEVIAGPAVGETLLVAECSHARIREAKALCDTAGHYSRPDVLQLHINRKPLSRLVEME